MGLKTYRQFFIDIDALSAYPQSYRFHSSLWDFCCHSCYPDFESGPIIEYPYRDLHLLGSHNNNDIDHKIPPDLPLSKGVPRFAGFGKEGLAPWSGETYSTGRGEIL